MRSHLYEYRSDTKKLKCLCGWERTMKTTDQTQIRAKFSEHCVEVGVPV